MAKFVVIKSAAEQVPFLRGILVQSLVSVGLSFQDAYATAQAVRDDLIDVTEITSTELTARVAEHLEKHFGAEVRHAYETETEPKPEIIVHSSTGSLPFSLDVLTRSLQTSVIDKAEALKVARRVHEMLQKTGRKEIDHITLRHTIYQCLKDSYSSAEQRYLSWREFKNTGDPLVLLIGGATGTGKSTIATELAHWLDVVRTQSTDMMRQIIRAYLAPHVTPTLAYSSFEAWQGLPATKLDPNKAESDFRVVAGFMAQFATIKVALEATIARAVREGQDLIVDGVHVLPTELDLTEAYQKAMVVPIMLVVTTKERLAKQLAGRSHEQPKRGAASRYVSHLDDIWSLQSYLLTLADKADIPVIANWALEDTVDEILSEISRKISERYPPNPHALG